MKKYKVMLKTDVSMTVEADRLEMRNNGNIAFWRVVEIYAGAHKEELETLIANDSWAWIKDITDAAED